MNNKFRLSITALCKIADVSQSGYYAWKNRKYSETENILINLIKNIYWKNNGKFGYRRITMELRRKNKININPKKVLRIMQQENLKAIIRKKNNSNSHFRAQRKSEKWTIAPNIINGNFCCNNIEEIYSTDVTYLKLKNGQTFFLSAAKDLATGEITGYSLSKKQDINLILDSIEQIKSTKNAIIHSDRGALYSSFRYIQKLKDKGYVRSMSEAGKPTQNSPIESFFGHLKDELEYKKCKNFEDLKEKIDKYVYYYNNSRYQWNKNMLAPIELKEYLISYNSYPF